MQAGQLGIAILYFLLLGFRLFSQGRAWAVSFLAGLALALPASVKLVPALPVVFLVFQQWSRVVFGRSAPRPWGQAVTLTVGVSTGVFLFLLAIPASVIGWHENLGYLRLWQSRVVSNDRVGGTANFNIHSDRNQSLANAAYMLAKSSSPKLPPRSPRRAERERLERLVKPGVRVAIGVGLALLLALGVALARHGRILDQATAYSLSLCATLVVSPLSWGHYYMALVPAVVCVPLWLLGRGMPRLARSVAVLPVILSWSFYVAMPYTGPLGLLGLGTAAWFLVACGLILGVETSSAIAGSRQVLANQSDSAGKGPHRAALARSGPVARATATNAW
jgi:hypothetical protein